MAKIFYTEVDDFLRKEDRYNLLNKAVNVSNVKWDEISPDKNYTWLTEGMQDDWEGLVPLCLKDINSIMSDYCIGVQTGRDSWAYNFNLDSLKSNMFKTIKNYNFQVYEFTELKNKKGIDEFVTNDDNQISWTSKLKDYLYRLIVAKFEDKKIRKSIYRPFCTEFLYYDDIFTHRLGHFKKYFPTLETEQENLVICITSVGNTKPFHSIIVNKIPDIHLTGDSQCFPFYTYNEDGSGRKENITDWALETFSSRYSDLGSGDKVTLPPTPQNPKPKTQNPKPDNQVGYFLLHLRSIA